MQKKLSIFIAGTCAFLLSHSPVLHAQESSPASTDGVPSADLVPSFQCKGMLKPYREVRLASRTKGVVCEIKKEGSRVKEGETVFRLEDNLERLQLTQQQHVVKVREFESQAGQKLSHIISQEEVLEKAANFEVAKIQRDQAEELLRRRTVNAPFDGIVTECMRQAGESVDEFIPVMTLVDLNKLYFEAFLPASRVKEIQEGQPVEIRMDTYPDKRFSGTIEMKSPVINPASGEFKVKIVIENKDGLLSSGLTGVATFTPSKTEAAVANHSGDH